MKDEIHLGADAAVDVSAEPVANAQLSHAATFDCTVVGGDSRPDRDAPTQTAYAIELRIHAPWSEVPVWMRTMLNPVRVTFEKAESEK